MGEGQRTSGATVNTARDPDELRAEIEETRRELGETVAALSAKTDVKARARERIRETRETVQDRLAELSPDGVAASGSAAIRRNPLPAVAGAALLAGFVLGRLVGR